MILPDQNFRCKPMVTLRLRDFSKNIRSRCRDSRHSVIIIIINRAHQGHNVYVQGLAGSYISTNYIKDSYNCSKVS